MLPMMRNRFEKLVKVNVTFFCGLLIILFMAGCAHKPLGISAPANIPDKIKFQSEELSNIHKELREALEKVPTKELDVKPVMPTYDPLEDRIVSFSLVDEDFKMVLYSLAQSVGMNLIVDPRVKTEERRLTINFQNVSAAAVLREVLDTFDLYYEVKANVIRVKPFQEKIFKLNFLDTFIDTDFVVGGDVLGAGEVEAVEGLTGSFKISGKGSEQGQGNPYDVIDNMVKKVISPEGKYFLNRLAGSLYVKDSPESIRSIARIVNHAKQMLSRQILIVARIIEVGLREEHSYGIDWEILWQEMNITDNSSFRAGWSLDEGLVLEGILDHFDIGAAVDALETFGDVNIVSNPSIRVKHGKPAIISVGSSISYTKSTETTILSNDQRDTITEVEVSKVFDGLILGVIPFIQADGEITLLINPIKSDVDRESLELIDVGNQQVTLPEVNIKEISTTISLKSGDAVILGGLIDNRKISTDRGVPILSSIPILGYLFKHKFKRDERQELVIILSVSQI